MILVATGRTCLDEYILQHIPHAVQIKSWPDLVGQLDQADHIAVSWQLPGWQEEILPFVQQAHHVCWLVLGADMQHIAPFWQEISCVHRIVGELDEKHLNDWMAPVFSAEKKEGWTMAHRRWALGIWGEVCGRSSVFTRLTDTAIKQFGPGIWVDADINEGWLTQKTLPKLWQHVDYPFASKNRHAAPWGSIVPQPPPWIYSPQEDSLPLWLEQNGKEWIGWDMGHAISRIDKMNWIKQVDTIYLMVSPAVCLKGISALQKLWQTINASCQLVLVMEEPLTVWQKQKIQRHNWTYFLYKPEPPQIARNLGGFGRRRRS
ncbi:MAG: hypothetical protein OWS74_03840 [Firmicutes bacterium]|nr:hypothetical protein [Bacillota bacterium]